MKAVKVAACMLVLAFALQSQAARINPLTSEPFGAAASDGGSSLGQPLQVLPGAPGNCSADIRSRIGWGVATAAYQVEGGWNLSGRTPSIWDNFTHSDRSKVVLHQNGDVADDVYHKYDQDFALMQQLGIKHYRFSISWNRIVPEGFANTTVNQEGVDFYNNMLTSMLSHNITPYATIFHWDLPQVLQDAYTGFISPRVIDDYAYYADVCFQKFGDRIKHWFTFNEPHETCTQQYGTTATFAPGVDYGIKGMYLCGHHLLLAHAMAVKNYRTNYQVKQGGKIGIVLNMDWGEPLNLSNPADVQACRNNQDMNLGWFATPIYLTGDYPAVVKANIGSDLPNFTAEQSALLKNSSDVYGMNHYGTSYVYANSSNPNGWISTVTGPGGLRIGAVAASPWLNVVPWGFYRQIMYITSVYNPPEIFVTENGVSDQGERDMVPPLALQDTFRIYYYDGYLDNLCRAVSDGAKITRYFAWSYCDNFEWDDGYTIRFGLVRIDYGSANLTRQVKDSGYWMSDNFFTKGL